MGIIALAMAFLLPALGPSSGRAVDAAAGQLKADLEGARLIAIAERTRTRVILPTSANEFTGATSSPAPWPSDIALRGYLVLSEKRTESSWKQRGKWNRFPEGVAVESVAQSSPAPVPAVPTDIGEPGPTSYKFTGPYVEFLANGSCNLDPAATPAPSAVIADGFVDSSGAFKAKNQKLRFTVAVDPLTGSVSVK